MLNQPSYYYPVAHRAPHAYEFGTVEPRSTLIREPDEGKAHGQVMDNFHQQRLNQELENQRYAQYQRQAQMQRAIEVPKVLQGELETFGPAVPWTNQFGAPSVLAQPIPIQAIPPAEHIIASQYFSNSPDPSARTNLPSSGSEPRPATPKGQAPRPDSLDDALSSTPARDAASPVDSLLQKVLAQFQEFEKATRQTGEKIDQLSSRVETIEKRLELWSINAEIKIANMERGLDEQRNALFDVQDDFSDLASSNPDKSGGRRRGEKEEGGEQEYQHKRRKQYSY